MNVARDQAFWPLDDQVEIAGPRLDRSLRLSFVGDIGMANFHRVAGWLAMETAARCGPSTRTAIWNGDGFVRSIQYVGRGEADFAVITPASFARMAVAGRGPYVSEAFPHLRALGVVAHHDRLLLAVDERYEVSTLSELIEAKPPLRIATAPDTGDNHVGLAVSAILEAAGSSRRDVEDWGGSFVSHEYPMQCADMAFHGQADALWHEAVMNGSWRRYASKPVRLVPIDDEVLDDVSERYLWRRADLPADHFAPGDHPVACLDFSGYLILTRADVPEDLVEVMTWCLVNRTQMLEHQYAHLPPERSAISFPLLADQLAQAEIELHPGAARIYKQALDSSADSPSGGNR